MELFLCLPIYDFATRNGRVTDRFEIDFLNALSLSLNSFELIKLIFSQNYLFICLVIALS